MGQAVLAPANVEEQGANIEDKVPDGQGRLGGVLALLLLGRHHKWPLARSISLIFMASACSLTSARFIGQAVEILAGRNTGSLSSVSLSFLALEVAAIILIYRGRVSLAIATNDIIYSTRKRLVEKLGRLPMSYFDTQPLGRTITRLTGDVEGVETLFTTTLARVLSAMITIISVFIAMIAMDIRFGALIVLAALPSLLLNYFARKVLLYWLRTHKKRNAQANAKLAEMLTGLQIIKLLHLEDWTRSTYQRLLDRTLEASLSLMNWNTIIRPLTVVLCLVPTVVVIAVGGNRVLDGAMSLGMLVVFVRYSERFLSPVRTISQEIHQIQDALSSSERISQLLLEPEEATELGDDGHYVGRISGEVEYRNVTMCYGRSSHRALNGISFTARRGMRIGLVGETGSGKSSTINLLPRLYPFQGGEILLDGQPIERWQRHCLRSQLGVVSQDIVIFRGTLRENLLAAADHPEEIGDERLMIAAKKTGLLQLMQNFSHGLDTYVHQGGSNLSVGERQLIAFTRMVVRDPAILILDEATANIDEAYEALIQGAISVVMNERTCFIVAHRLSTIIQCDLILVFRSGHIVERGTHVELLAKGGYYSDLVRRQLQA